MNVFDTQASHKLHEHATLMADTTIASLFKQNPQRFDELHFQHANLMVDFSKQRITTETLNLLCLLAKEKQLDHWISALFSGQKVNASEKRPALHTALRAPVSHSLNIEGRDVVAQVHANIDRMSQIVNNIHTGQWLGCTGHPVKSIVNIGVGGSDLGPLMACGALEEFSPPASREIDIHFVSSMDGSHLSNLLGKLDPTLTLFVISSKSFTTVDTLANANTALEWLKKADAHADMPKELIIKRHFIGISANHSRMIDWGIPEQNHLYFWDWTGGRYSLWSTIGFSIAIRIGIDGFRSMLSGAHAMDCHFHDTDFSHNLPVLLALVGIWNVNFLGITAHAVLPYDGRLAHLPSYLEQLEMESNGKNTNRNGDFIDYNTCPILWGEIGTNAQHAFYQLLHQGTIPVMCDFIACAKRYESEGKEELKHQHQLNLSNCLAQSQLLALGDTVIKNADLSPPYKRYRGNQPCTTLLMERLTPFTFGMLIALYEHKVFVQSVIWDINPFDQWGVELGKSIATGLLPALQQSATDSTLDSSTSGLIQFINR